ncbi:hypothetical protein EVAR_12245_1 [Eumeta japonica]|uniref:Uncharacterized protein n=1 Tax=Eumeta variegata TaxID=151549 RepID=A0A4C1TU38_EUMVA|nr:hypothetical protein EVAR_12245_1 [Eumeta japonica]
MVRRTSQSPEETRRWKLLLLVYIVLECCISDRWLTPPMDTPEETPLLRATPTIQEILDLILTTCNHFSHIEPLFLCLCMNLKPPVLEFVTALVTTVVSDS